jgi:hypothetical protein
MVLGDKVTTLVAMNGLQKMLMLLVEIIGLKALKASPQASLIM